MTARVRRAPIGRLSFLAPLLLAAACQAGATSATDTSSAASREPAPLTGKRLEAIAARRVDPRGAAPADPLLAPLQRFIDARGRIEKGDGEAALRALDPSSVDALPLAAHVHAARAEAHLLLRNDEAALAEIEKALDSDPPARLRLQLSTRAFYVARGMGKEREAAMRLLHDIAELPEAIDRDERRDRDDRPTLRLSAARTLAESGAKAEALEAFRRLAVDFPLSDEASEAEEAAADLGKELKQPGLTGADRLARVLAFLDSAHNLSLKREIDLLRKTQNFAPTPDQSELLARAWGHALLETDVPAEAIAALKAFEKAVAPYPEAAYDLAEAFGRTGDDLRRVALLQAIVQAAQPNEPASARAVRERAGTDLARDAEDAADFGRAAEQYLAMAEAFPESRKVDEWLFRGGFLALLSGDDARATSAFTREVEMFPDSTVTPAALYWRSRTRAASGEKEGARADCETAAARAPRSFYGRLCQSDAPASVTTGPVAPEHVLAWRDRALALGPSAERALLLHAAGLSDLARMEAEEALRGHPDDPAALTLMAMADRAAGRNLRARELMLRAAPGLSALPKEALPEEAWAVLYPLEHKDAVVKAARAQGLPVSLLYGLIWQESGFETDVVSRSGALGLAQLMPGTASDVARKLGIEEWEDAKLFDAEANIAVGAAYLASLLRACDGSVERALAGYNGGPNRIERLWARLPKKDPLVFIESIPIKETRLYVKKVLEAKAEYERIYGPF